MAHDGSYEVTWKGQAFPFLLHREGFGSNDSYGQARQVVAAAAHGVTDGLGTPQRGHTAAGVWDGPAPRGYAGTATAMAGAAASNQALSLPDPDNILLSNGARMPLIGLGTAMLKSTDSVKTALELGYRSIDCAAFYNTETLVGEGLKEFLDAGRRAELFITSKVWNTHHRPADVKASCEQSLRDLGCTYLDLFLMHWPEAWLPGGTLESNEPDTEVTVLQTWAAMEELQDAGLVRAIGVSNFSLTQVEDLLASCRIKPVVNQVEMHPLLAQRKLLGVCFRKGVQCVAYSPLGSPGHLRTNDLKEKPAVLQVAREAGKTPAQVLLRWNVQRGVPVIPKASSREHLAENLQGLFNWRLSNEHKALLDAMDCNCRFIDFPWKKWDNPEEGGATKPSRALA